MVDNQFLKGWLQRPDYQSGVAFYLLHGKNETLKKLFQKGPTDFTKRKLQSEMAGLAMAPKLEPKPMRKQDFVPVPDWLQKLGHTRVDLIKEQQYLHSQLIHYPTDEERCVAALRILDLVEEITGLEHDQNEYKEHGKVPVKEQAHVGSDFTTWGDIRLCEYLYNSLRSRKTRAKKDPEKLTELLKEEKEVMAEIDKRR